MYVSGGDGSTSEGEFWESLNNACLHKVPVLFLIEDNNYAISVPVEKQTAGGSISRLVRSFPDLFVTEFDGCNFVESYSRLKDAVAYLRAGRGPALAHAHVVRPYSHSLSDDERLYKTAKEREEEAKRDPVMRMRHLLLAEGLIDEKTLAALEEAVHQEVVEAADQALSMRWPTKESWSAHLYSPTVDPTAKEFESAKPEPVQSVQPAQPVQDSTMVDLLNACLRDEMRRDPRIIVFGQDVADASREENLAEVKGKGGVFKVTLGLQREFGIEPGVEQHARRGQHRGARHRRRGSRIEAGGRDPVPRLHLARVHADSERARHVPLALERSFQRPVGDPGSRGRVPARRSHLPQPVR